MAANTQETRYSLAKRELLGLQRAKGNFLVCESGEVWITRDGSQEDMILAAGERWQVEDSAALVVSALSPAVLIVAHPEAAAPRIAVRQMAESILLLIRRWKHRPLAGYPSTLVR